MPWYFYNNRGVLKQPGIADPLPVGLISPMVSIDNPVLVPPSGWLLCNGAVQPTASYPELAAVLAYPAAPGVTFTLPNLNGDFVMGASGTYPLNSVGGTSQHPHTINGHTHTNTHQHTVTDPHFHNVNHGHTGASHAHGGGPYNVGAASGGVTTLLTGAGLTTSSHGNHVHTLVGSTGSDDAGGANKTVALGNSGTGTSGTDSTGLDSTTPVISPVVDTLPPYLNVYYIIKAVDFSGTYI